MAVDGGRRLASTARYSSDDLALREADVILVATKAHAIPEVADRLRDQTAPIVSLMNGPTTAVALAAALGRPVLKGMVPWNAVVGPGLVTASGTNPVMLEDTELTRRIATFEGPLPVQTAPDIDAVLWGKLLLNLINPVNALHGGTLRETLLNRPTRTRYADALAEGLAVLKAAEQPVAKVVNLPPRAIMYALRLPNGPFERFVLPMQKLDVSAKTSMAIDLTEGRRTEIEWLTGALCDLARAHGVKTPVNDALMAEVMERQRSFT